MVVNIHEVFCDFFHAHLLGLLSRKKKKNLRAIYLKNSPGDRQEKQTEKQIYKTSHGVSKPSDCSSFSSKSLKTMVHY